MLEAGPADFELALQELAVGPGEVLYIGDSLTDDYEGATRAGIDFVIIIAGPFKSSSSCLYDQGSPGDQGSGLGIMHG